ncbi:MAG: peptide-methionine (R)-S-oxide reductase MsrB [Luteitalea sp.]|nr:peptide-methionine (R)-S-oxide reductase MsrB [Luteitalea sp.]
MERRHFFAVSAGALGAALAAGGWSRGSGSSGGNESGDAAFSKSKAEWKKLLPEGAYRVLFEDATERSFTSPLNDEKREGTYVCAACFLPLFESATKFDSRTGWPSFYRPIDGSVETKSDYKLILRRTEYHCGRCGGHQGHVFDDGPPPTGQRWCNNGLALQFVPKEAPLPALRT